MQPRLRSGQPFAASAAPTLGLVAVVGLTAAVYVRFLTTGFAATDSLPLVESSRLVNPDSLGRLFTTPVMAGSSFTVGELVYRPFVSLTFGFDYLVWGLDSAGYHVSNLVLHLATVAAVWLLLTTLGLSRWASVVGATLFSLHPVVVATVPVIARRDSVVPVITFATAAALSLIAQDARGYHRSVLLGLALVLAALALLSKESAFVAVGMLPLLIAARSFSRGATWRGSARAAGLAAPFLLLAGLLFAWRLLILRGLGGMADADLASLDFERYRFLLSAYVRNLLWAFADLAPATRPLWLLVAGASGLWLALTLGWLPRRQAALATAGAVWIVGFGVFCAAFKITTIGWLAYFSLVGVALLLSAGLEGAMAQLGVGLRCLAARDTPWASRLATVSSAALLCGLLVFGGSAVWASALFRDYSQWQVAGDVEQRYMQALTACVGSAPTADRVNLRGVPSAFEDGRSETGMLGVTLIEEYTAQSALRLALPDRPLRVHVESAATLHAGETLQFACRPTTDGVEFTALY